MYINITTKGSNQPESENRVGETLGKTLIDQGMTRAALSN